MPEGLGTLLDISLINRPGVRELKISKKFANVLLVASLVMGSAVITAPVANAGGIFNPDACIVQLGWNMNLRKQGPDGIAYYMYGSYTGPNSCPSGSWRRLPGHM
ncbi:hypothetical protein MIAR_22380 [Microbacterium arabinogalactanolyticum]|nr:hypothetical protein MIAR_22380 [Microbacterium arabinogalactanolyticum]